MNHGHCVFLILVNDLTAVLKPAAYKFWLTLQILTGVGCDAKVALDIHNLREENPERFYSQVTKET